MIYTLDGIDYEIIIDIKPNKNLYIRVKDDNKIHVICNKYTTKRTIEKVLMENEKILRKMIESINKKEMNKDKFYYLGKPYNIILTDINSVIMEDDNIYTKNLKMLDKWLKEETIRIFDERYVYVFNKFKENIKSPILKIRNMKTRWGVYNRQNHTITLNSRLIEYDYEKIDYVIIHELSHIIHFDHSKDFWLLISKYCTNYKKIRKEMKD